MQKIKFEDLLGSGAHFGHVTRKWNPNYKPYILMEKNGVHIINLDETIRNLKNALDLNEDQCLDQCKLNKNCKAIIHDNTDGNSCYHLSNVSNHRTLESGNAQLFIRD